jgi:hypothetical protein
MVDDSAENAELDKALAAVDAMSVEELKAALVRVDTVPPALPRGA